MPELAPVTTHRGRMAGCCHAVVSPALRGVPFVLVRSAHVREAAQVRPTVLLLAAALCCASVPALAQPSAPAPPPVCTDGRATVSHFPGGAVAPGPPGVAC